MESRIALITGANTGIGFEIARQVGKAGAVVLLGARKPELGEAAEAAVRFALLPDDGPTGGFFSARQTRAAVSG
ncbi:MAG: SDR family NAD(P)-dependent oxidoreductase [Pseudorhodoplanes sp.]